MNKLLAAFLLAASIVVGGCGASATTERHRFVEQATAVCSHFSSLQNEVQFPSTDPVARTTTHAARAEWAVSLKQVAYLGTQEVKSLRALEAPDPLAAQYVTLLSAKANAYGHLLAAADAAKRNRVPALRSATAAGKVELARATTIAAQLGMRACR